MQTSIFPRLTAFCLAGALAAVLVGCGSSNNKVTVKGTVTYKGKPLPSGKVQFYNAKSEPIRAAPIQKDGTYIATDIPREQVKVTVETTSPTAGMPPAGKAPPGTPVIPDATPAGGASVAIPAKYKAAATSGLSYNITEADQKVDITLD